MGLFSRLLALILIQQYWSVYATNGEQLGIFKNSEVKENAVTGACKKVLDFDLNVEYNPHECNICGFQEEECCATGSDGAKKLKEDMPRFALPSTSNNPQNVLEAPTTFQRVSSPQTMDNLLQMEDVFSLSNHNHLPETGVFTGDPKYSAPPDVAPSVPFGHESSEDTGLPEGTDFIHRPSPGVATLDRIPGTQSSLHSHSGQSIDLETTSDDSSRPTKSVNELHRSNKRKIISKSDRAHKEKKRTKTRETSNPSKYTKHFENFNFQDEADYVSSLRLITKDSQLSRLMTTINNKSSKEAQSSCIYDDGAVSIESNDQEGRPLKYPKLNKKHSFRDNTLDKMKSDLIRKVPHQRGVGKRNYRNEDDYGRDLIFMEQLYAIAKSPILPEDHTNTEWYKEWKKSQILKSSLKRKENFLAPELYLLLLLHESNDIDQFAFLLMCTYNDWMVGKSTQNFQYKAIGREFTMGRLTDVWQRYLQSSLSLVGLFEPNSKKLKEYPITFEKITINRFLEISNWMWQVQCLYKIPPSRNRLSEAMLFSGLALFQKQKASKSVQSSLYYHFHRTSAEFGTSMKLPGTLTGSLMRKITAFTLHTFEQSDKLRVYLQERLKVKSMPFWDSVLQEKNFKIANGLSWDNLEKLTNSLLHQYKYSEDHMKLATDWGFEGSESKKLWQLVSEFEMATKQQQMGMDLVYEEMNVYLHINGLDSIQTKKEEHQLSFSKQINQLYMTSLRMIDSMYLTSGLIDILKDPMFNKLDKNKQQLRILHSKRERREDHYSKTRAGKGKNQVIGS